MTASERLPTISNRTRSARLRLPLPQEPPWLLWYAALLTGEVTEAPHLMREVHRLDEEDPLCRQERKARTIARTDAEIAREIKRRMKADFEVPDDWITLNVTEGLVTIEGTVVRDSAEQRGRRLRQKSEEGVRGVVNRISRRSRVSRSLVRHFAQSAWVVS